MCVLPEPQMHQRLAKFGRYRVSRNKRAPGGAVTESRRGLSVQTRGNVRPDSIGADERDPALVEDLAATLAEHADPSDMGRKVFDPNAQLKGHVELLADSVRERRLQIPTMDRPIGGTVTAFQVFPEGNAHDLPARAPCHHPDRLRLDRH